MRPTPGARRSDSTVSSRSPWWATSYPRRSPRRSPRARNRRARLVEYRPHASEVTVEPRGKLPQPVRVALTRGALDLAAERADIVEAVAASRAHERMADLARDRQVARLDCSADFVRHLPAVRQELRNKLGQPAIDLHRDFFIAHRPGPAASALRRRHPGNAAGGEQRFKRLAQLFHRDGFPYDAVAPFAPGPLDRQSVLVSGKRDDRPAVAAF